MLSHGWHSVGHSYGRWAQCFRAYSQWTFRSSSSALTYYAFQDLPPSRPLDAVTDAEKPRLVVSEHAVFEEHTEEYAKIIRDTPVPGPSVLSLVEAQLPARLPQPSPTDTSIFEDSSDLEYLKQSAISDHNPSSILQTLHTLINNKRFNEVDGFYKEIVTTGIELPPSYIWEIQAQSALAHPSLGILTEDQKTRFLAWFHMVPPRHGALHRTFKRTRWLVFEAWADLSLAIRFSVLLASKGYGRIVAPDAIPFIMTFAPPAASLQFLMDFEKADLGYIAHSKQSPQAVAHRRRFLDVCVLGPAIRALTLTNRINEAISLLPDPEQRSLLPHSTYKALSARLRQLRLNDPQSQSALARINKLRSNPMYSRYAITGWTKVYNPRDWFGYTGTNRSTVMFRRRSTKGMPISNTSALKMVDLKTLKQEISPNSNNYVGDELAKELQNIIDNVRIGRRRFRGLVSFIRRYLRTGRVSAIVRLRRLSLHTRPASAASFLLAEMTYYFKAGWYYLALKTFVDHFFLAGIPHNEVIDTLRSLESERGRIDEDIPYAIVQTLRIRKLWPKRKHCDLVWQVLIKMTSDHDLQSLYKRFIYILASSLDKHSMDTTFLRFPFSGHTTFKPVVFTAFIQRLLSNRTPEHAFEFITEMMKHKVSPSIHHFTQIGYFYAQLGDTKRMLMILDTLENENPAHGFLPMREDRQRWTAESVPRPDVVFYTALMRGLINSGCFNTALEVEKRFRARYVYRPQVHPPLDVIYSEIGHMIANIKTQASSEAV